MCCLGKLYIGLALLRISFPINISLILKLLNRSWLEKAGVRAIDICPDCTKCQPNRFWSHRVTGGNRGSQAAIIRLKGGAPA